MLIPFKSIDGKNIAQAEVEIPEQILNRFAVLITSEGNTLSLPHVRAGAFTRTLGDVPLRFEEKKDKLAVPDSQYKGIHVSLPNEDLLKRLGFQQKGPALYNHPGFISEECITFDVNTDDPSFIIRKVFNLGFRMRDGL